MLRVRSKRLNRTVPLTDIKFRFGGIVENTVDNEYFKASNKAIYIALIGQIFNTNTDPFEINNVDAEQIVDRISEDFSDSNAKVLFFEYFFGLFSPIYQRTVPVNDSFDFNKIKLYKNDEHNIDVKIYQFSRLFKIYTFDIRNINIDEDTRIIRPTSAFEKKNENAVHSYLFDTNERMSGYRDVLRPAFGKLFQRTRSIENHFNAITKAYYPLSTCDRKDLMFLGDEDAHFDYIGTYILYLDNGSYRNLKWENKKIDSDLSEVYRAFDSFTNAKLNYLKVRRLLLIRANILFRCFGIGVQFDLPKEKDTKELTADYYRSFVKTVFESTLLYTNRQNFISKLYTNLFINTKKIEIVQQFYNVSNIQSSEYNDILDLTRAELGASTDVTGWEDVNVLDYTFDKAHEERFQQLRNDTIKIQNLTDQIENLKSQLKNPSLNEKQINELKESIEVCENNLSDRNTRIDEMQEDVAIQDQRIKNLLDERSRVNIYMKEDDEHMEFLNKQVEEKQNQIETLRENIKKMERETQILDLNQERDNQIETLDKNEPDIGTITRKPLGEKDWRGLMAATDDFIDRFDRKIDNLNSEIMDQQNDIEILNEQIVSLENDIEILNEQIVSLENVNRKLTTQASDQLAEINTLNASNVDLREQFNSKNQEMDRLRSKNAELTSEINDHKAIIDRLEIRSSTATGVINALKKSNAAIEKDKNDLLTQLNKSDTTINDKDKSISELLDKNKSLSEKVTRLEDELGILSNEYTASLRTPQNNDNIEYFESLIASKDEEIARGQTDLVSLERKNTLIQNENTNLKRNNINLEGKIRDLENVNNRLKEEDNVSQDNYSERIRDLERENERLLTQISSNDQYTLPIDRASMDRISGLEEDKQRLQEELREANRIITSSRAIARSLEEENRVIRQRIEEDTRYEHPTTSQEGFVRSLIENAYLPNTAMALDSLRKSLVSQFV